MSLRNFLTTLENSGLIRLAQTEPELEYLFRHALIQETTYQSMLKEDRRLLHKAIGELLEQIFANRLGEKASTLAFHFDKADEYEKALKYMLLAGRQAVNTSSNQEAIHHLNRALTLLKLIPENPQTIRREMAVQTLLGSIFITMRGFSAPEVGKAYKRVISLCEQNGLTARRLPAQVGLCVHYLHQGKMQKALEVGQQCLNLAKQMPGSEALVYAYQIIGFCYMNLGHLELSQSHLEKAIKFYNPQKRNMLHAVNDPGIGSMCFLAWDLWLCGFSEQALQKTEEAMAAAQELGHPYTLGFANLFYIWLRQQLQDDPSISDRILELEMLSITFGFIDGDAYVAIINGMMFNKMNQVQTGIVYIRRGLEHFRERKDKWFNSYFLLSLSEGYLLAGQIWEGLSVLNEARELIEETQERFYDAELYRLEGELLSALNAAEPKIAQCFYQAIETARHQQAKTLELRATMSLCRLLDKQGKREEARHRLEKIYHWFTEGFDTVDLLKARKLLSSLA